MQKIFITAVCVLFLCGGLFCLHLTAQPERAGNVPSSGLALLLERKLEDASGQELLEWKVESRKKICDVIDNASALGAPEGRAARVAEVYADLAAAEIELYRHTGDRVKLLDAHKSRIKLLTDKLRAITVAFQYATAKSSDVAEAEIQLLDALLEQKRDMQ